MEDDKITEFENNGVVVLEKVFDDADTFMIRQSFHRSLKKHGCDVTNLDDTAKSLEKLSSTSGAGGILVINLLKFNSCSLINHF